VPEDLVIKGTIVTPSEIITRGQVVVEDGKITQVSPETETSGNILDFHDCLVAPGLIDIHVHGGGGRDVMDASLEGLNHISCFLAAGGVTSFIATTYTASQEDILAAAETVREAVKRDAEGAEVLGLHLEGPYINPKRRGAQSATHIRLPSMDELREIYREAGGSLKIVTLAPEMDGALEAVSWLRSAGVVPSAGHTDATYGEMMAGVEAGLCHAAHLFNGMRPFHHRDPGVVVAALEDDRVSVELIADTLHLHPASLRLATRVKGMGRSVLVSDAIAPAGLPDGEYRFGEEMVHMENGRCLLKSGVLAGSTIRLSDAVRNMVELVGVPLNEAIWMASSAPARVAGVAERKGQLAPGMDADVTVFNRDFSVLLTMVEGKVVYERR
jgi:N-acetylglucosamine-6-phosphate deacetylase